MAGAVKGSAQARTLDISSVASGAFLGVWITEVTYLLQPSH
ncbi:hypothetical protein [Roseovarius aestuarii]|uniref:Uncharacterized protein n=1 Tax=Roseovarius aestuarii TaxID=475083 RepID=A0A1X7BVT1_9RHOB|nr:hypothetical protein [Roseovarius aestuarii]SMC13615.1 hypothetical protein ROA7745_03472 [Roseovarius aestuarii]